MRKISAGSPTPIIIPPAFQREPNAGRAPLDPGAVRTLASQLSVDRATTAGPSSVPASAPTMQPQQQQQQQQPAPVAEAQRPPVAPGPASAATSALAAPAVAAAPAPAPAAAPAADIAGSSSSSSSAATAAGAAVHQQREKPVTTRAERRAQQEAQRAAKAAAKAGAAPGGAPASGGGGEGRSAGGDGRPPKVSSSSGGGAPRPPSSGGADAAPAAPAPAAPAPAAAPSRPGSRGSAAPPPGDRPPAPGAKSGGGGRGGGGAPAPSRGTQLFAHLPQYKRVTVESALSSKDAAAIHPAILALGLRIADGSISGGNARAVALLDALSAVVSAYTTPEGRSLPRDLMSSVNSAVDFLVRCRPLSVSMGNAIKFLKLFVSRIDPTMPEAEAKEELLGAIRDYIHEKVIVADRVLVGYAVSKIYDGDVVLTYAYSSLVLDVLLTAYAAGRRFRVVVLDSRPEVEGRRLLRRLLQADVPCSYTQLSGASFAMREATKVLLGAAAVLSNGTVMSRAGAAAVAMLAADRSLPVLVVCEAHKLHERVQLDSITHNELGDPGALALLPPGAPAELAAPAAPGVGAGALPCGAAGARLSAPLAGWREHPRLSLLNLKYDAMPADYVTMVVTEFGMVPPSSVPVILREFSQQQEQAGSGAGGGA